MFKGRFKKVVVSTLALIMVVGTVAMAAGVSVQNIPATYGRIRIQNEGVDVTDQVNTKYGSPAFVTGGRSYVPVRAIADVLGVQVDWDGNTHTANFTNVKEKSLQLEIVKQAEKIAELEKEIKELKEGKVEKADLSALQKELQKDYKTYRNVDFDIKLKGDEKEIEVVIEVDLRNQERAWERMSTTQKEKMIEEIVDKVKKEFKDTDVKGSIYDLDSRSDLFTFTQKGSGRLDIRDKDFDAKEVSRFAEDEIKYEMERERLADLKVTASERNGRVTATVKFDKGKTASIPSDRTFGDIFYDIEKWIKEDYSKEFDLEVDVFDISDGKEVRLGSYYNGTYK